MKGKAIDSKSFNWDTKKSISSSEEYELTEFEDSLAESESEYSSVYTDDTSDREMRIQYFLEQLELL